MRILFPSSYMNSQRVDEAFEGEYEAALQAGMDAVLFRRQVWDEKREIRLDTEKPDCAVYRGWMMKPEVYRVFYDQLRDKGISLLTAPDHYETMHLFPNAYKWLEESLQSDPPEHRRRQEEAVPG
jgi:hypothetical protein